MAAAPPREWMAEPCEPMGRGVQGTVDAGNLKVSWGCFMWIFHLAGATQILLWGPDRY